MLTYVKVNCHVQKQLIASFYRKRESFSHVKDQKF